MSDNPVRIWDYTPVIKYNPNHDSRGRFGSGGGGGGGGASTPSEQMMTAVNAASSLAIQHGDTRTKDAAYAATREADDAKQRIESGKYGDAKEYIDGASDRLQSLPELAEKAGADGKIVDELSTHANTAWQARTAFLEGDKKLDTLSREMFNHKQQVTPSMRAGKINTKSAQAHIARGQDIISRVVAITGGSRESAMKELNSRMGLNS
jgi:hypothetical protein